MLLLLLFHQRTVQYRDVSVLYLYPRLTPSRNSFFLQYNQPEPHVPHLPVPQTGHTKEPQHLQMFNQNSPVGQFRAKKPQKWRVMCSRPETKTFIKNGQIFIYFVPVWSFNSWPFTLLSLSLVFPLLGGYLVGDSCSVEAVSEESAKWSSDVSKDKNKTFSTFFNIRFGLNTKSSDSLCLSFWTDFSLTVTLVKRKPKKKLFFTRTQRLLHCLQTFNDICICIYVYTVCVYIYIFVAAVVSMRLISFPICRCFFALLH